MDTNQWDWPIEQTAILFRELAKVGIVLDTVNIGGGFPVRYNEEIPPIAAYAETIGLAMRNAFGKRQPKLMLEPGRSPVAEAGSWQGLGWCWRELCCCELANNHARY